jgi:hypothetical protein
MSVKFEIEPRVWAEIFFLGVSSVNSGSGHKFEDGELALLNHLRDSKDRYKALERYQELANGEDGEDGEDEDEEQKDNEPAGPVRPAGPEEEIEIEIDWPDQDSVS